MLLSDLKSEAGETIIRRGPATVTVNLLKPDNCLFCDALPYGR